MWLSQMHSLLLENFQFGQENKVDNSQRFPLYFFLKAAFSKEDFFMLYLITLALKKVMKTWDCEKPNKTRAKKVVIPPLMMAGPILFKLLTARSSLVPGKERKKILDNRVVEDSKAQYKTKTWIIPSKIQQIQSKNPWWTYFSKVFLCYVKVFSLKYLITVQHLLNNGKIPFVSLAKKDNLMLLNWWWITNFPKNQSMKIGLEEIEKLWNGSKW